MINNNHILNQDRGTQMNLFSFFSMQTKNPKKYAVNRGHKFIVGF